MDKDDIIEALVILVAILICICGWLFINRNSLTSTERSEAFHDGYDNAIKHAQLIEVTDDAYYIQFGTLYPSVHEYSFD